MEGVGLGRLLPHPQVVRLGPPGRAGAPSLREHDLPAVGADPRDGVAADSEPLVEGAGPPGAEDAVRARCLGTAGQLRGVLGRVVDPLDHEPGGRPLVGQVRFGVDERARRRAHRILEVAGVLVDARHLHRGDGDAVAVDPGPVRLEVLAQRVIGQVDALAGAARRLERGRDQAQPRHIGVVLLIPLVELGEEGAHVEPAVLADPVEGLLRGAQLRAIRNTRRIPVQYRRTRIEDFGDRARRLPRRTRMAVLLAFAHPRGRNRAEWLRRCHVRDHGTELGHTAESIVPIVVHEGIVMGEELLESMPAPVLDLRFPREVGDVLRGLPERRRQSAPVLRAGLHVLLEHRREIAAELFHHIGLDGGSPVDVLVNSSRRPLELLPELPRDCEVELHRPEPRVLQMILVSLVALSHHAPSLVRTGPPWGARCGRPRG